MRCGRRRRAAIWLRVRVQCVIWGLPAAPVTRPIGSKAERVGAGAPLAGGAGRCRGGCRLAWPARTRRSRIACRSAARCRARQAGVPGAGLCVLSRGAGRCGRGSPDPVGRASADKRVRHRHGAEHLARPYAWDRRLAPCRAIVRALTRGRWPPRHCRRRGMRTGRSGGITKTTCTGCGRRPSRTGAPGSRWRQPPSRARRAARSRSKSSPA